MTTLLQRIIVSLAKKLDSSAVGKVPPPNPIDASIGQKCEAIEPTAFSKLTPLRWILEDGAYVLAVKADETLHIKRVDMNEYEMSITENGTNRKLGTFDTLQEAFEVGDNVIRRCRPSRLQYLTRPEAEYEQWLSRHQSLVDKFLEVADRKVSTLDDYGDENWDALPKEIRTCLLKIARTEDANGDHGYPRYPAEKMLKDAWKKGYDSMLPEKYKWIKARLELEFRKFHDQRARNAAEPVFDELSGVEFETYLARLLKQDGFENIRGTAATGDQGADLLATKANRTIVIQAKRYRGAVGNKAVQEVAAAVKFYRADEGWVITSGTFTASAKALAQANNVRLIDGYALRRDSSLS